MTHHEHRLSARWHAICWITPFVAAVAAAAVAYWHVVSTEPMAPKMARLTAILNELRSWGWRIPRQRPTYEQLLVIDMIYALPVALLAALFLRRMYRKFLVPLPAYRRPPPAPWRDFKIRIANAWRLRRVQGLFVYRAVERMALYTFSFTVVLFGAVSLLDPGRQDVKSDVPLATICVVIAGFITMALFPDHIRPRLGEWPARHNLWRFLPEPTGIPKPKPRPARRGAFRLLLRHWRLVRHPARRRLLAVAARLRNAKAAILAMHWVDGSQLSPPTRCNGVFERYRAGWDRQQELIRTVYVNELQRAHPMNKDCHTPIDIAALPPDGRLMFLPVVIGADDGRYRYDRLDFDASDFDRNRYVFRADRRGIDIEQWRKALPTIESYLAGTFRIVPRDGASLVLERLPDIPPAYQLQSGMLQPGSIFLGLDVETAAQVRTPLSDLSHTLVAGASGAGKSSLMHQAMASVLANIDAFEAVYLVDLKFGLEAALYASVSAKITVVAKHDQLPPLLDQLLATLERRAAVLAAARETKWRGPQILIVIDEFADVLLGAKKPAKEELETKLVRLANLSRAFGIRFWVQTQHVDASTVPMAFRRNMATLISFRMPSNQLAAMFFGAAEDLPADITRLRPGQFIHRDGLNSHTTAIQGALVTFADVERMMRPKDSETSTSAWL